MSIAEPWLAYAKLGAIAVLVAAAAGAGFHFGGLSADDKLNAARAEQSAEDAAQLRIVVATLQKNARDAKADHDAQQKVIDDYDVQSKLPPITTGIVERMRLVESTAAPCASGYRVPASGGLAGGADATGGVPRCDPEGDRLLQVALDKAAADSLRLDAAVKLAPKHSQ